MSASLMCPGRSNPFDADDGVTNLQERVLSLLEDAGLSQAVNDQIMRLVAQGEREASEAFLQSLAADYDRRHGVPQAQEKPNG